MTDRTNAKKEVTMRVLHIDNMYNPSDEHYIDKDPFPHLRKYLRDRGIELVPVARFDQAMEVFRYMTASPAVILDLGEDEEFPGVRVIEQFLALPESQQPKIIVFSMYPLHNSYVQQAIRLGAHYVHKDTSDQTNEEIYQAIVGPVAS